MSYPYPPMGPGEQPSDGQATGWGATPSAPGGYGPATPGWQHQETMAGGAPVGPPAMTPPPVGQPPMGPPPMGQPPAASPYGQPPFGQPPMGPPPMGPPPKKSNAGLVITAIGAAVVVVGGVLGGAYYAAAHGGDDGGSGSRPAAAASASASTGGQPPAATSGQDKPGYYNSMKSWSLWSHLDSTSSDSKPMTLKEVFDDPQAKEQKDTLDGTVFKLQGNGRLDTDCGSTVWGAGLKAALRSYGCTQVIRAAYLSGDKHWIGELAIFNLKDVQGANALLEDLDPRTGKGFFLPVSGPSPIDRFGKGTTGAHSGAYGHFVVVGWAGRADGQGDKYGTDTISPSASVQQAGKEFLFTRNVRG